MNRFFNRLFLVAALIAFTPTTLVADGVTGGTGIQALPAGVGIGNSPTTFNPGTGGSQQSLVQGSTAYLQASRASKTNNYTVNSDLGGVSDCPRLLKANGTASIQFTAPNPVGTLCTYQFADQSGHGYTVNTPGGTATFYGCVSPPVTILTVPPNNTLALDDDGTNYFCSFAPQTQAAQINQSQTWGPQYSTACTISPVAGVFTPTCPISYINLTAANQHIALPNFMPPNTASTFVNLVLTYGSSCTSSSLCTPIFDGPPLWPGVAPPPACAPAATTPITVGCFSSVQLPAGQGDWIEGRSIDATHVGYGTPLTDMGAPSAYTIAAHVMNIGACNTSACTQTIALTSGDLLIAANYSGSGTVSSISASPSNIGTCTLATGTHGSTGGRDITIYLCPITGTNASNSVTVNFTGAGYSALVALHGASGTPDVGVGNYAYSTTFPPTVNTNGSANAGNFVLAFMASSNGPTGSSGTIIDNGGGTNGLGNAYSLATSTAVQTLSFSGVTGSNWAESIVAIH